MASTGPKYPGNVIFQAYKSKGAGESSKLSDGREKEGIPGDSVITSVNNWQNEANIKTENAICADVNLDQDDESNYLIAHDFGFALTKTVRGIEVEYKIKANKSGFITMDLMLTLNADPTGFPPATPVSVNKATGTSWPSTLTKWTAGGSTDLWGYGFTKELINQSGFGVMLKVENLDHDATTGEVDYIRVTVHHDA